MTKPKMPSRRKAVDPAVTVHLPESMLQAIDRRAHQSRVPRSEIIRRLIQKALADEVPPLPERIPPLKASAHLRSPGRPHRLASVSCSNAQQHWRIRISTGRCMTVAVAPATRLILLRRTLPFMFSYTGTSTTGVQFPAVLNDYSARDW